MMVSKRFTVRMKGYSALLAGLVLFSAWCLMLSGTTMNSSPPSIKMESLAGSLPIEASAIDSWGSWGGLSGQLNRPYAMVISDRDWLYVCDTYNHRIQVFDTSGSLILSWGSFGTGNGQFNTPGGIALDTVNEIVYVSDTKNKRIQMFSLYTGQYIDKFSIIGEPEGIAVDSMGNVYVADRTYNWIRKFALYEQIS